MPNNPSKDDKNRINQYHDHVPSVIKTKIRTIVLILDTIVLIALITSTQATYFYYC